jgi:hypothetical protein
MQSTFIATLAVASAAMALPTNTTSTALTAETNCEGAWSCSGYAPSNTNQLLQEQVQIIIEKLGGDAPIGGGQIACVPATSLYHGSFCAFYQDGANGTAQDVYNELGELINYGCTGCGSVSTNPGILTVNYVSNACCPGDCVCWNTVMNSQAQQ